MTYKERKDHIVRRFNEGVRSDKIADEVGVTQRQVQRVIHTLVGGRPVQHNSVENALMNLRPIIIELMREQGRDFSRCELCGDAIPEGKFDLHHTKYKGATFRDLRIVCRACNLSLFNKYLD